MHVFLFPGQGSQEVGMGADLFKSDATFRSLVQRASDCIGADLKKLCLRGPERELARTKYLQPLLTCVSLGYLDQVRQHGVQPDIVLGHSLGEISALAAVGIVTLEDAVAIAAKRGELMDAAAERVQGGMLAVIGAEEPEVRAQLLQEATSLGAFLANDNAPSQSVFSGTLDALDKLRSVVSESHWGRCVKLAVRGPWHSPFMADAQKAFSEWLASTSFRKPEVSVLLNGTATPESDPERIRSQIVAILTQPVRWRECMACLRAQDASHLFEVGPGRVLSGLARANGFDDSVPVHRVNDLRGVVLAAEAVT